MNNPFGLPDEVFDAVVTSIMKQGMTKPPLNKEPLKQKMVDQGAEAAKMVYDSYVKVGFTEFQAFEILKCALTNKR